MASTPSSPGGGSKKDGTSKGSAGKRSRPTTPIMMNTSMTGSDSKVDQEKSVEEDLPSINERLGHLRPSRELLEYYRKKIAEYDEEHESMVCKLEDYKCTYEEMHKMQWDLQQREEEIVELQKALSDMQVYLFQEREHVLRLYAENDRLKIRELEDKKKIQQLLALGDTPDHEMTYFMKEPPAKAIVEEKTGRRPPSAIDAKNRGKKKSQSSALDKHPSISPTPEERFKHDNDILMLQVESLQAQIQDQAKLAKEQIQALQDDRHVKDEEMETRRQRDEAKLHTLTEKLHKTQDLLYESTKDFLELRYQGRANERLWIAEKDKLLRELDFCKQQLNMNNKDSALNTTDGTCESRTQFTEELKSLEYQLQQSQKLSEMYREQVIQLEDELARIREEGDVTREVFKDRGEKMSKRLQLMNQRYQDLERRRNLEVEGFKTDIKNLRTRLKEVERQLYKVTLGFSEDMDLKRPDDIDMQILRNVRATSGRSKKLVGELKNLKAKIYGIESDLKHL